MSRKSPAPLVLLPPLLLGFLNPQTVLSSLVGPMLTRLSLFSKSKPPLEKPLCNNFLYSPFQRLLCVSTAPTWLLQEYGLAPGASPTGAHVSRLRRVRGVNLPRIERRFRRDHRVQPGKRLSPMTVSVSICLLERLQGCGTYRSVHFRRGLSLFE